MSNTKQSTKPILQESLETRIALLETLIKRSKMMADRFDDECENQAAELQITVTNHLKDRLLTKLDSLAKLNSIN